MSDEHEELVATLSELAEDIREIVLPLLGTQAAKRIEGQGASGDATFSIDEVAEGMVDKFLNERGDIAYYTEDRGLVVLGKPKHVFVIDPIDGTRPAAAGLESCCFSAAVAPYREGGLESLRIGDVFLGLVSELKNRASFIAIKDQGVRIEAGGSRVEPELSPETDLGRIFWTIGFRGRPAEPLVTVLGELIDLSSVDGGCFDLGSACFCITRIVKGEMDLYVDVGQRMADEVEQVRKRFLEIGHGSILNNYPYDVAAAALVAAEAGALVTDAYGCDLGDYPLIPERGGGQVSAVVSANPDLHSAALAAVERGMARLRDAYGSGRR